MTMASTTILKADGAKGAKLDLSDKLFGAPVNTALIHQAAVRQLAARRIGTADTLTRPRNRSAERMHPLGTAGNPLRLARVFPRGARQSFPLA